MYRFITLLYFLFISAILHTANATDTSMPNNSIGLLYGEPTSNQNKTIYTYDIEYQNVFMRSDSKRFFLGAGATIGQISVDNERGERFSLYLTPGIKVGSFTFALIGGGVYLTKTVFGENELHTKDYGGHFQFKIGANAIFHATKHWTLGYQFEHMSNWNNYSHNPALNTHNIVVQYLF
ncbi:acyloxyacyl hydrolase [Shewanella surugensis]|uniref:Acyloxyacyl hydrolase n=1 Tax=Shewanella surugensis TaxID=212020 RepID=A0ABT0LGN2_9GAMM|nr:acyloxyacyl hydrolase [Shewanella surugensis]MCL1126848.1 acyloxyacyl hydrolase [Shewanella surugensis]